MILEYCDGGELKWKDRFGQPYLSLDETRKIFRDTLLGLAYCRSLIKKMLLNIQCTIKGSFIGISSLATFCSLGTVSSRSPTLAARIIQKPCIPPPLLPGPKAKIMWMISSWPRRLARQLSLLPKCVILDSKPSCRLATLDHLRAHQSRSCRLSLFVPHL